VNVLNHRISDPPPIFEDLDEVTDEAEEVLLTEVER